MIVLTGRFTLTVHAPKDANITVASNTIEQGSIILTLTEFDKFCADRPDLTIERVAMLPEPGYGTMLGFDGKKHIHLIGENDLCLNSKGNKGITHIRVQRGDGLFFVVPVRRIETMKVSEFAEVCGDA